MTETYEQITMFSPDLWFSKTSQDCTVPTEERISAPFWKKLHGSQNQPFLFLDMRGGDGSMPELLSDPGGVWHGERMTQDGTAYLNGGVVSLWSPTLMDYLPRRSCLSAILEEDPDPKYTLSAKACAGILRRAVRRGKIAKMPPILVKALEKQAGVTLSEITLTEE